MPPFEVETAVALWTTIDCWRISWRSIGQAGGRLGPRLNDPRPVGGDASLEASGDAADSGLLRGRRLRRCVLPDEDELRGVLDPVPPPRRAAGRRPGRRGRARRPRPRRRPSRPSTLERAVPVWETVGVGVDGLLDERELGDRLREGPASTTPAWSANWSTSAVSPATAWPDARCAPGRVRGRRAGTSSPPRGRPGRRRPAGRSTGRRSRRRPRAGCSTSCRTAASRTAVATLATMLDWLERVVPTSNDSMPVWTAAATPRPSARPRSAGRRTACRFRSRPASRSARPARLPGVGLGASVVQLAGWKHSRVPYRRLSSFAVGCPLQLHDQFQIQMHDPHPSDPFQSQLHDHLDALTSQSHFQSQEPSWRSRRRHRRPATSRFRAPCRPSSTPTT